MKKLTGFLFLFLLGITVLAQSNLTSDMDQYGHIERTQFTESIKQASLPNATDGSAWSSLGPDGGDVMDVAIDPLNTNRIFAAAGIPYVSEDMGENWLILDELSSIVSGKITSFEVNSNGVVLAAGLYNYGKVFRSEDEGLTWTSKSFPLTIYVLDITFDPNDPDVAYCALAANGTSSKVLIKSENAGSNWSIIDMITALPNGYSLINIIVDPDNSQNLYGVANSGISDAMIVASFDGGTTWSDISGNLPSGKPYNQLAMVDGRLYMAGGQLFGGQTVGVYVTEDNGTSWQNISSTFPIKVSNFVLIDPNDHDKLYVGSEGDGIYYSNDAGANWNFDGSGAGENGSARYLAFEPGNSQTLYAGFLSLAVCKSTDAALNWEYANKGIATLLLDDIEVNTANPEKMLVGFEGENSGGCYMSNDGGLSWELVTSLPSTRFSQVAYGATGNMYAWSNGPTTVATEGLYKSDDNGLSWTNLGPFMGGNFETQIFALTVSATNSDLLLVGGNNFGSFGWESMIYRSIDDGANWDNVVQGPEFDSFKSLYIDPNSNDQIIYSAYKSDSQAGFMKSEDGGATWNASMVGVPTGVLWCGAITSDPDNSDMLYGGVGGYGFMEGSIYRSENAGGFWEYANLTLGSNYAKIADLMVSPENSGVIYAATTQEGVFLSSDTSASWHPDNEGFSAANVTGFSNPFFMDDTWQLCASTFTNSAFITDIYNPSGVGISDSPSDENGFKLYPNPSNGRFVIESDHLFSGPVDVSIFNLQGREVYHSQMQSSKENIIEIDVDIPAGIWMIRLVNNAKTHTKNLIIY